MSLLSCCDSSFLFFFFFNDPASTEIYTFPTRRSSDLSRHRDATLGRRVDSGAVLTGLGRCAPNLPRGDRKSTRLNSSHLGISYAVFCLKKKKNKLANSVVSHSDTEPKRMHVTR